MGLSDLRHALRLGRRAPFLTAVVVLILAGGIAVTTAVFGLVNAVWLRPLPYPDAGRLVVVNESHPRLGYASLLPPTVYQALRESRGWADGIGAFTERSLALGWPGARAERVRGISIDPALLRLLGARPIAGRLLRDEDARPGAAPVALVSERFWRRQAGADKALVGRTVRLDGVETTVAGVLPYGFRVFNSGFDVFAPLPSMPASSSSAPDDGRSLLVVARLAPGVTRDAAAARLEVVASQVPAPQGRESGWKPILRPLDGVLWGEARPAFLLLLAAALLLLALIAANVSNLLLARSEARRQEFAVRLALGAGRTGILRQLLTEGLVLAIGSAVLALLLCAWLQRLLVAMVPEMTDLVLDGRVFAFASSVSILVGLAFGLLPALSVLRHDVLGGLQGDVSTSRVGRRTGRWLAAGQLAAAAALLTCCGLLVRGAIGIRAIDPGFATDHLLTASVSLPTTVYPTAEARRLLCTALASRIAAIPGTESVALTTILPLDGGIGSLRLEVEGRPTDGNEAMQGSSKAVSAAYFRTIGAKRLAGETFRDQAGRYAMANAALARALWKTEAAAVGARIRVDGGPWRTVIGVVSDVRQVLTAPPAPEIYLPIDEAPPQALSLIARTTSDPMAVAAGLASAVREVAPDVPVSDTWSMAAIVDAYFPAPFVGAFLLLSVIALLLGALGLYAVIAFQVTRRGREFGIRMALGASPRRLLRLILWEGLRLTALGLVGGGLAGLGLGRVLASRFTDVRLADPALAALVALALGVVSLAACLAPARRATKATPAAVLRRD